MCATGVWSRAAKGRWAGEPGANDLDSGAPFYDVYATCDGEYMQRSGGEHGLQDVASTVCHVGEQPRSLVQR